MRDPIVAGMFYAADPAELESQIDGCFKNRLGPGKLPSTENKGNILGAIVPHAGYAFSGPCAAHAYKMIAESEMPETFIILGTSHSGYPSCASLEDWDTPLGTMKVNKELAEEIIKKAGLNVNETMHSEEHSIEVQLPFLQSISRGMKEQPTFIPLSISHNDSHETIGKALNNIIKDRKICILASSDFTHYGPNYGYTPFSRNIKNSLHKLDNGAISHILRQDPKGFDQYLNDTGATICGAAPIVTLLHAIKAKNIELLKYYTSGDITGDYTNAVGYASILFK